ncbi:oxidoreductase [Nocardioides marmorisolisilvae]|uniref:Oxidoreductase n=1 Tax=Nocardioides marmorisolisilvae TaxID=1542737 RepID=A0A3N0DX66_9ACTN|nr:oxidoreductase [Nocardioides marmorisolisilvae]
MISVGKVPAKPGRSLNRPGQRARYDADVRILSTVILVAALALVTYWWIDGGGLTDLGGWASGLTSVGRITGLVASVLLLAQILLMARLPAIERAFGQDRLVGLHRWIGFTSFNLMVAHIVTITWGYDGGTLPAFPRQFWNLVTTFPGVLLSVLGSAYLVGVTVTSIKAARRKLRYESWHLMHLYAYLGVGLAIPHQLWTGQQFVGSPSKTLFWWTAWGVTMGTVLVWRVGLPVTVNLRHRLKVESVVDEGHDMWSVNVTGRDLGRLKVEAGQFFNWRFMSGPGWSRSNPYSLSAAPDGRTLRITVQGVGDGSNAVSSLRPGTRVFVEGPYGRLSNRPRTQSRLAFIGAGVGITPLRALAEGLDYEPGSAVYLERFTYDPLFPSESTLLAQQRGLQVIRSGGPRRAPDSWIGSASGDGDDLTTLQAWIPDIAERDVYICGPVPWSELVLKTLRDAGVPDAHVHIETFAW